MSSSELLPSSLPGSFFFGACVVVYIVGEEGDIMPPKICRFGEYAAILGVFGAGLYAGVYVALGVYAILLVVGEYVAAPSFGE